MGNKEGKRSYAGSEGLKKKKQCHTHKKTSHKVICRKSEKLKTPKEGPE